MPRAAKLKVDLVAWLPLFLRIVSSEIQITDIYDPILKGSCVVPASQISAAAMLVLLIAWDWEVT
jgi:hypothetical protein